MDVQKVGIVENIYKKIGEKIKYFRTSKCCTQDNIASLLGLDRTSVIYLESGKQRVSIDKLEKLAIYFDISIGDFFEDFKCSDKNTEFSLIEKLAIQEKELKTLRSKINSISKIINK